jgi:hypothetical protein
MGLYPFVVWHVCDVDRCTVSLCQAVWATLNLEVLDVSGKNDKAYSSHLGAVTLTEKKTRFCRKGHFLFPCIRFRYFCRRVSGSEELHA